MIKVKFMNGYVFEQQDGEEVDKLPRWGNSRFSIYKDGKLHGSYKKEALAMSDAEVNKGVIAYRMPLHRYYDRNSFKTKRVLTYREKLYTQPHDKGVCKMDGEYMAYVQVRDNFHFLGLFKTKSQAKGVFKKFRPGPKLKFKRVSDEEREERRQERVAERRYRGISYKGSGKWELRLTIAGKRNQLIGVFDSGSDALNFKESLDIQRVTCHT